MDKPDVVAVVGSREYPKMSLVRRLVESVHHESVIVSGEAQGVDRLALATARRRGLATVSYQPQGMHGGYQIERTTWNRWDGYNIELATDIVFPSFAEAAHYRNGLIVRACGRMALFWDGLSTGTQNTLGKIRESGKPFVVIGSDGERLERRV